MMRTSCDPEAMFIWFGPEGGTSAKTEEVADGVLLDFDDEGKVIGVEVLDIGHRMTGSIAAA